MENRFFAEINRNFGFGCMRLPMKDSGVDLEQMAAMVDAFLTVGFNYFDTAHGYLGGASETALRETLVKRYPRDRYVLTNKLSTHFFKRESDLRNILTRDAGRASDCVRCGKCEKICPQHLPIRELLKGVATEFEQRP